MIAFILGGAENVLDEYAEAKKLINPDVIICVNDIGYDFEKCDIWTTLHPENLKIKGWISKRINNGFSLPEKIVAHKQADYVNNILGYKWKGSRGSGSGGLYAVKVALSLGYNKIVLCGVPMNKKPHYFDKKAWTEYNVFVETWDEQKEVLKEFVRSMSGYTKELLGYPDKSFF